ncbi:MAG: AI-2 transport protein TqsA [Candidatus Aerophobetes bacterium ADurb.Bin490]|nr:MAG: AI-2 transport protein TqsA [Candidatus Aerophobetes bacterium ADurb.Bin490]
MFFGRKAVAKPKKLEMSKKTKLKIILGAFAVIALIITIGLGYALKPLLIAFGLSYLVFPLIIKLEKRGLNRVVSVTLIFLLMTGALVFSVMAVMPKMVEDTSSFFRELPENSVKALRMAETIAQNAGIELNLSEHGIDGLIKQQAAQLSADAVSKITGTVSGFFSSVIKWLLAILNVLLIPLFFFFMIIDYEKMKEEIKSYIPVKYLPLAQDYMGRINRILSGYIRGKLVVAFILGLLYGLGLYFIGLKFGFVIGFAAGVLSIIPYVGSLIGFVAAVVMALAYYQGIGLLIGIGVVFTVAQLLESYIITPRLVGESVGLNAFITILAIIIGGNLMGVMGILIAIPVAAILKEILVDLRKEYHLVLHEPVKGKRK